MEIEEKPELAMPPEAQPATRVDELPEIKPALIDEPKPKKPLHHRFRHWYIARKKSTIPGSVILLVLLLGLIPWSRYHVAGLVLKKDAVVIINDSVTHTPVSGATVSYGSGSAQTDANGKATLHALKVGPHNLNVSKKYYQDRKAEVLVPVLKAKKNPSLELVATGRQVKIKVTNYVDGSNLPGVNIEVAGTSAKLDKNGEAIVVVPTGLTDQKASLSLDGFNDAEVTVKISDKEVALNSYKLVPAGRVYFFSNRSGKMDLMKTNLDGSDLKTVLPGTGTESPLSSLISQSPDWKYLALLVKRSSSDPTPQLYILSTSDDKLLGIDTGNYTFNVQGWAGDSLIYTGSRNDLSDGQAGKNKLKSYDATTGKTTLLDQSAGVITGSSTATENYSTIMVSGNTVVFAKTWAFNGPDAAAQQASLQTINSDGQNHKQVASYDQAANYVYFSQHGPAQLYIWQQSKDSTTNTYLDYTVGAEPKESNIDSTQFYKYTQGYYPSASGSRVLWTETRDGKNAFLVADSDGSGSATIGSFNDYLPYGWFGDKYILMTLKNNELYIMPAKGGTPLKITDYQSTNYYY